MRGFSFPELCFFFFRLLSIVGFGECGGGAARVKYSGRLLGDCTPAMLMESGRQGPEVVAKERCVGGLSFFLN